MRLLTGKKKNKTSRAELKRIFDDLDLSSTRKPGSKTKLPVPMEGDLVRSLREVRGR